MPISSIPLPGDEEPPDSSSQIAWLRSLGDREALFQVLDAERRSIQGLEAAGALARLGDVRGMDHLIAILNDPRSGLRMEAAETLQQLGHPRALRALRESQTEKASLQSPTERDEAFLDLNAATTDELVAIWHESDSTEWTELEFEVIETILAERLGRVPRRAKGADEGGGIDSEVDADIQELWELEDAEGLRELMEQDAEPARRLEAAEALASIGYEDALDFLIASLDDADDQVSDTAAEMLDWLNLPRGAAALRQRGISFETEGEMVGEPTPAEPLSLPAVDVRAPEKWVSRVPGTPGASESGPQPSGDSTAASLGGVVTGAAGGIFGFLLVGLGLELIGLRPLPDEWRGWLQLSNVYWAIESLVIGAVGGGIGRRAARARAAQDGDDVDEQDPRLVLGALSGGAIFVMVVETLRFLLTGA